MASYEANLAPRKETEMKFFFDEMFPDYSFTVNKDLYIPVEGDQEAYHALDAIGLSKGFTPLYDETLTGEVDMDTYYNMYLVVNTEEETANKIWAIRDTDIRHTEFVMEVPDQMADLKREMDIMCFASLADLTDTIKEEELCSM